MSNQLLNRSLMANAIFSILSGSIMLLFPSMVAELTGAGPLLLYQIIGAGLLGFALYVGYLALRPNPNVFDVLLVSLGDIGWVLGSILLLALAYGVLSTQGIFVIAVVALIVLAFAAAQLRGIDRLFQVTDAAVPTHRICIEVQTDAAAAKIWPIIADMGRIKEYSPHLASSSLRDGAQPAPGAVRECSDTKGNQWAEKCTLVSNEERQLSVTFLADEPGFPYPFRTMDGGWQVQPNDDGSIVTIWFETTPKQRWAAPFILAIMTRSLVPNFTAVVSRMAAKANGRRVDLHSDAKPWPSVVGKLVAC